MYRCLQMFTEVTAPERRHFLIAGLGSQLGSRWFPGARTGANVALFYLTLS